MDEATKRELMMEVHAEPLFEHYASTNIRNNTNCYSHALGATSANLRAYRIGAISNHKPINEEYRTSQEIERLLFEDCKELQLKIEKTSLEENLSDNQFIIALFIKKWANGKIADYHFLRLVNGVWTEKWRGEDMNTVSNFATCAYQFFPWNLQGFYQISK